MTPGAFEIVAELTVTPGNVSVSSEGRTFLSLHQFGAHEPDVQVVELVDGAVVPYPDTAGRERLGLQSVLGIQADAVGRLWLLDNGNQSASVPRLIAWDTRANRLERIIELPPPITHANSFVNALAVDLTRNVVYISDPIQETSAILRVDLATNRATRLLEGHVSVVPEDPDLVIEDTPVQIRLADGSLIRPHLGVNGITIDTRDEWVYYCPMHARGAYRVRSADLADPALTDAELGSRVERYADRPICDGISIDAEGNLYLGDLSANAIGVIRPDRSYLRLTSDDALLSWVDSFSFGPDGALYCNSNQLHRSAVLNGGVEASRPPFFILRVQPFAPGVPGR